MNGTVSVVIRSRTWGDELLELLAAIRRQSPPPLEIVVIDSGSAGWVVQRLRALQFQIPLKLIEIAPADYQSARALNRAIAETCGELVAILSQDALPAGEDYLERLVSAFDSDSVAGAYGRQIPGRDDDPLAHKDLVTSYPPTSRVQSAPDCWFVNTCSMVRRDVWLIHPFEEQAGIVEDHQWARHVQADGFVVKYQADAVVRHHHRYRRARDVWQRFYLEGLGLAYVHGTPPRLVQSVGHGAREAASDALWLARRRMLRVWPAALARRAVKHAALYWGYREHARRVQDDRPD